ncbi:hypothetical protein BJF84_17050 [Rhodococcus sp. CUA-806]|nr:hypothetical protein BJF84_17050 [Rhodococcus sp. CUA-806]
MTMPAGWFADPEGSGQLRWWDGQQWTSSLQPPPYSAQTPNDQQPGGPPSKKWPWVVGGVVGILVFIGIIGALGSGDDTSDVASVQETTRERRRNESRSLRQRRFHPQRRLLLSYPHHRR